LNILKAYKLWRLKKANERRRKSVLTDFIQNIYLADGLPDNQARDNLESSVIEIVYQNGYHSSCGLLITTDGYLITCYHCVSAGDKQSIVLADGTKYPIVKICAYSKPFDLALVKAEIPVLCEPKQYRFYVDKKIDKAMILGSRPTVTLTRWNKKLNIVGGISSGRIIPKVNVEGGSVCNNQIYFKANLKKGDSGGTVISAIDRKVYGIHSNLSKEGGDSMCTQWCHALELIVRYTQSKTGFK